MLNRAPSIQIKPLKQSMPKRVPKRGAVQDPNPGSPASSRESEANVVDQLATLMDKVEQLQRELADERKETNDLVEIATSPRACSNHLKENNAVSQKLESLIALCSDSDKHEQEAKRAQKRAEKEVIRLHGMIRSNEEKILGREVEHGRMTMLSSTLETALTSERKQHKKAKNQITVLERQYQTLLQDW